MAVTYRYKARASGCRIPAASPPERGSVRKLRWPRPGSSPTSSVSHPRPINPRSSPRRPNRIGYQPELCNKAGREHGVRKAAEPGAQRDDPAVVPEPRERILDQEKDALHIGVEKRIKVGLG